jgi:hypothetical protein
MYRERRHWIRGVGGVLLGLAFLVTPMVSASLAEAGGKPGHKGAKPSAHRDKAVRVQDAPRPSGKPVLVRPGRVVVSPPPRVVCPPPVVRRAPVVVYRRPPVVRRAPAICVAPMWAAGAPYFWVNATPYYFNAGLGVYLGGVSLAFQFTNAPPPGYVYFDPYCGVEFSTVAAYRGHLACIHHAHALQVVPVAACGY